MEQADRATASLLPSAFLIPNFLCHHPGPTRPQSASHSARMNAVAGMMATDPKFPWSVHLFLQRAPHWKKPAAAANHLFTYRQL